MQIERIDQGHKGYFLATSDGVEAGRSTYTWSGTSRLIIDHTEVNPAFKGKNVGKQLVTAAVEFARENKLSIIPLCPFAKSLFDRTPDWSDVLFAPTPPAQGNQTD
jgi:predicted GNAT family acetyltransferase